MKKYFLILSILVASFITACTPMMYSLNADCNLPKEELFSTITTLLVKNGFSVTVSDLKIGYLQGEMIIEDAQLGNAKRVWTFQIEGNKLISTAKGVRSGNSMLNPSVKYYYDKNTDGVDWYWDIRNAIGKLCTNLYIVESEQK